MESFHEYMDEYKHQVKNGVVKKAYKGLMEYIMYLRTYFQKKYPEYFVSGSIYYGYMDMSYFSVIPPSLKQRQLKIALVFIHETCKFEVWLAGYNKKVQSKYWNLFNESSWNNYHVVSTVNGADSILEHTLIDSPDFSDLDTLTKQIEKETFKFIGDVESFLSSIKI